MLSTRIIYLGTGKGPKGALYHRLAIFRRWLKAYRLLFCVLEGDEPETGDEEDEQTDDEQADDEDAPAEDLPDTPFDSFELRNKRPGRKVKQAKFSPRNASGSVFTADLTRYVVNTNLPGLPEVCAVLCSSTDETLSGYAVNQGSQLLNDLLPNDSTDMCRNHFFDAPRSDVRGVVVSVHTTNEGDKEARTTHFCVKSTEAATIGDPTEACAGDEYLGRMIVEYYTDDMGTPDPEDDVDRFKVSVCVPEEGGLVIREFEVDEII